MLVFYGFRHSLPHNLHMWKINVNKMQINSVRSWTSLAKEQHLTSSGSQIVRNTKKNRKHEQRDVTSEIKSSQFSFPRVRRTASSCQRGAGSETWLREEPWLREEAGLQNQIWASQRRLRRRRYSSSSVSTNKSRSPTSMKPKTDELNPVNRARQTGSEPGRCASLVSNNGTNRTLCLKNDSLLLIGRSLYQSVYTPEINVWLKRGWSHPALRI